MEQEDIKLIEEAKKDKSNFAKLYYKYANKIFNYFWYRVGHQREVAEDLTQETFLKAFNHLSRFQNRGYSYLAYLKKIAHSVLVNYYRRPRTLPLESVKEPPYEVSGNIEELERKEKVKMLWRAIQQLPPKERNILFMRYRVEMSIAEISEVTGKTENAVKLMLSRIRKKLFNHPCLFEIKYFSDTQKEATSPEFLKNC
jgi:RNA polymerase sigma-70 factor (ECF subfamily)